MDFFLSLTHDEKKSNWKAIFPSVSDVLFGFFPGLIFSQKLSWHKMGAQSSREQARNRQVGKQRNSLTRRLSDAKGSVCVSQGVGKGPGLGVGACPAFRGQTLLSPA